LVEATASSPTSEAVATVVERGQDDYVLATIAAGAVPERALVHVQQAFADAGDTPSLPPDALAALTTMEAGGQLTATQAKDVLAAMLAGEGADPAAVAAAKGYEALDTSLIEAALDEAIAGDPGAWAKYCAGDERAAGAIVGRVMKATKGRADGKAVNALLQARRASRH
jgi:aspartyl-tRNA(Asn)/glutamyl-tRNA(Gln) amidotransferase subunit B